MRTPSSHLADRWRSSRPRTDDGDAPASLPTAGAPDSRGPSAKTNREKSTDTTDDCPGHVCVFTSAHPTDDVRVNSKIAASLLQAGYSVSWVGPRAGVLRRISGS